jgi:hypothetical protein
MKGTSALSGVVLASALMLPAAEAMANVVYSLHETTINGPSGFVGTLSLPGSISTDTTFPVSDFTV